MKISEIAANEYIIGGNTDFDFILSIDGTSFNLYEVTGNDAEFITSQKITGEVDFDPSKNNADEYLETMVLWGDSFFVDYVNDNLIDDDDELVDTLFTK